MIDALRTLAALRHALEADGLGRDSPMAGGEMRGWLQPNVMGSTGFSVRGLKDGGVEWHLVLSGKRHLRYEEYEQEESRGSDDDSDSDVETYTLHQPIDPDRLSGRIRKAFLSIGVEVDEVKATDWQTMWDDDVGYTARGPRPDWLEPPSPDTPRKWPSEPILVSLTPRHGEGVPHVQGSLVGYVVDGRPFLTRESLEALAAVPTPPPPPSRGYGFGYGRRLSAMHGFDASKRLASKPDRTIANHWGDEVPLWSVPSNAFDVDPCFTPSVAFVLAGETRDAASFPEIDAQFAEEAPWTSAASAASAGVVPR